MIALSTLGQSQGPAAASRHSGEVTSIPVIIPRFSCASPQPPSGTRLSSLGLTPALPSADSAPPPRPPRAGHSPERLWSRVVGPRRRCSESRIARAAQCRASSPCDQKVSTGFPGPSRLPARVSARAARSGLQPLTRAAAGSGSTTRRRRHPEQSAVPQAGRPGAEPGDPLP